MDIAANPFFGLVVDGLVSRIGVRDSNIARGFVTHESRCIGSCGVFHESMKHLLAGFLSGKYIITENSKTLFRLPRGIACADR